MPDLLFIQQDGAIKKSTAGSISAFSSTNFTAIPDALFNFHAQQKIYRCGKTGALFFLKYVSSTSLDLMRYDMFNDVITKIYSFTNPINCQYAVIYGVGDEMIVLYPDNGSGFYNFVTSIDGGWSWSSVQSIAGSIGATTITHIIRFKGNYFVQFGHTSSAAKTFLINSDGTVFEILATVGGGGKFAILNGSLYLARSYTSLGQKFAVYRISQSGSITQLYLKSSGMFQTTSNIAGIIADTVNDKLFAYYLEAGTPKIGVKSNDGIGDNWTEDNSFLDNITAPASDSNQIHPIIDESFSKQIQGMYTNRNNFYELVEWNTTTQKFDVVVTGGIETVGLLGYRKESSFCRMKEKGMGAGGTRYLFDIQNQRYDGNTNNIDPKFSTNWENFNAMTIDESKTGLATVLPDVTIGSDTNKFNDDFAADYVTNYDGYETTEVDANITVAVEGGVLKLSTNGNAGEARLLKRFIVSADFRMSLDFSGISATLATANTMRFGIRARKLSDNGNYLSDDNWVEVYVEKTAAVNHQYGAKHKVSGTEYTATPVASPTNEAPGLWIKRVAGVFTTAYGTSETSIQPGTTLSDTGAVVIEIFLIEGGTSLAEVISLDNLHLYSGTVQFVGGKTSEINWNFNTDGIVEDTTNVVAKTVADIGT